VVVVAVEARIGIEMHIAVMVVEEARSAVMVEVRSAVMVEVRSAVTVEVRSAVMVEALALRLFFRSS